MEKKKKHTQLGSSGIFTFSIYLFIYFTDDNDDEEKEVKGKLIANANIILKVSSLYHQK